MGFQSQSGSVGFKTQSVKGTYAPPSSGGIFMRTQSGALVPTRSLLIPNPEIGGNRDVSDAYIGPYVVEGEYTYYPRYDSLATQIQAAFGIGPGSGDSAAGSGSTLVGTHTITPVNSGSLPWLSIEENIGSDLEHFRYTDCKANTFHLEAGGDTFLSAKTGFVGLTSLGVPSASATANPTFDTGPLTVGTNITATYNGVALPAKSFTFDVNNNLEKNDFRLGQLGLGDTTEMRREFTAGFKVRPVDHNIWREAVYGGVTPGSSTPASTTTGNTVRLPLVITLLTYEFIGTTTTFYELVLTVPQAIIEPHAITPSGDSVIEEDFTVQFIRPDPTVPICTAVVTNHLATVL